MQSPVYSTTGVCIHLPCLGEWFVMQGVTDWLLANKLSAYAINVKCRGESPMLGLGSEVDVTQVEQTLRRALIALLAY
jgi:hypothetical protein